MWLGNYILGNVVPCRFSTHNTSGTLTSATGSIVWRMYKGTATAAIITGTAVLTNSANTEAFYLAKFDTSATSSYVAENHYEARIQATVGSVTAAMTVGFYLKSANEAAMPATIAGATFLTTAAASAAVMTALQGTTVTTTSTSGSLTDIIQTINGYTFMTTAKTTAAAMTAIQGTAMTGTSSVTADSVADHLRAVSHSYYSIDKSTRKLTLYKADDATVLASGTLTDNDTYLSNRS